MPFGVKAALVEDRNLMSLLPDSEEKAAYGTYVTPEGYNNASQPLFIHVGENIKRQSKVIASAQNNAGRVVARSYYRDMDIPVGYFTEEQVDQYDGYFRMVEVEDTYIARGEFDLGGFRLGFFHYDIDDWAEDKIVKSIRVSTAAGAYPTISITSVCKLSYNVVYGTYSQYTLELLRPMDRQLHVRDPYSQGVKFRLPSYRVKPVAAAQPMYVKLQGTQNSTTFTLSPSPILPSYQHRDAGRLRYQSSELEATIDVQDVHDWDGNYLTSAVSGGNITQNVSAVDLHLDSEAATLAYFGTVPNNVVDRFRRVFDLNVSEQDKVEYSAGIVTTFDARFSQAAYMILAGSVSMVPKRV